MISRRNFALAGLAAVAGCTKRIPSYDIYVANEAGNAVAVVDLTVFALTRHIALPDSPTAVTSHPNLPRVYALTPKSGTVFEIDTTKLAISRRLQLGASISMRMIGDSLWVLGRRSLTRVSIESMSRDVAFALHEDAQDFDLANYTDLAAIGSATSVSVIDLKARSVGKPVRVSDEIGATRFRSDGKGLLVADKAARQLCVLDQSANRIVNLPLAVRPDNLCFNQDGGQLFITGEGQDVVVAIFPYYVAQVAETVLAGHAPGAMAASPTHLFLANPKAGDVTILSIARRKIVGVVAVGADPGHIAVTPDGNFALVLNRQSGDMAVIRTAAIVENSRKRAPLFTMIPVGSRPVSAAVKAV